MYLQPVPQSEFADCPFPFFDEKKKIYKVYHDGSHHVGTVCYHSPFKQAYKKRERSEMDNVFDELFYEGVQSGIKIQKRSQKMFDFIKPLIQDFYSAVKDFDEWLRRKIERKAHNFYVRERRFRRKAYLNRWNYFVTVTYDDNKFKDGGEVAFRRKLRRYLSNLHTRHGWKYMGVFERAPETGRLHFHALAYIPAGEMVGTITEKEDYSTKQHKMQIAHVNSAFEKRFGRNDFDEISDMSVKLGRSLDYVLKYIDKTNERIVYSRGIPTECYMQIDDDDIACEMKSFVTKYLLFDDVVDYEYHVLRLRHLHQISMEEMFSRNKRAS